MWPCFDYRRFKELQSSFKQRRREQDELRARERDELRARVERSRQAELEELERNDARRGLEQRRLEQSLVVRDHASERKRMQRDLQRVRGDITSAQRKHGKARTN